VKTSCQMILLAIREESLYIRMQLTSVYRS